MLVGKTQVAPARIARGRGERPPPGRWICLPGDPGSSGRGKLMDSREPRRRGPPFGGGKAAMPLGLDGEIAGQASAAVIGALPGGQRSTAGEGLAQGQDSIIGLARADEEPPGTGPVFASEGDTDQVLGGLVTLGPLPSLVEDRRGGGAADRFRDFGVTVPERSRGVTRVDHLAAVAEPEPHPVAAHHPQILGLTSRQAGREQTPACRHERDLPPIPHRAAGTPSSTTQICGRASSPNTWHAASVSAAISRSFIAGSPNLRSTALTSISGMALSPLCPRCAFSGRGAASSSTPHYPARPWQARWSATA